jgi:hypothetical protein
MVVLALAVLRGMAEAAMIWQFDSDPQLPIAWMFLFVKAALWIGSGALLASLVVVAWPKRIAALAMGILLAIWCVGITSASWQYVSATRALADAKNPATDPERLSELVHFDGIQAGYELDNRLASNRHTPPESLRELSRRGNSGTLECLRRNPNTPSDLREQLADHFEEFVRTAHAPIPSRVTANDATARTR